MTLIIYHMFPPTISLWINLWSDDLLVQQANHVIIIDSHTEILSETGKGISGRKLTFLFHKDSLLTLKYFYTFKALWLVSHIKVTGIWAKDVNKSMNINEFNKGRLNIQLLRLYGLYKCHSLVCTVLSASSALHFPWSSRLHTWTHSLISLPFSVLFICYTCFPPRYG